MSNEDIEVLELVIVLADQHASAAAAEIHNAANRFEHQRLTLLAIEAQNLANAIKVLRPTPDTARL